MNGGVSIIIPVYNGRKYLIELLDSIFEQTFRPLEVLIGDDASLDDSVLICENWKKKHSDESFDVKLFCNRKNRGLAKNTSALLKRASKQYVMIADQDDKWFIDKVDKQWNYMEQHPNCAVCLCDRSVTDKNLVVKVVSNYVEVGYSIKSMNFEEVIRHSSSYAANTMIIRNYGEKVFDIPAEIVSQDLFLTIMASVNGSVDFLYEPLLYYRIHEKNLSNNFRAEASKGFISFFFRSYFANIRAISGYLNDGEIIKKELKDRYCIDLEEYDTKLIKRKETRSVLGYTWDAAIKAKKSGRLGKWNREKKK